MTANHSTLQIPPRTNTNRVRGAVSTAEPTTASGFSPLYRSVHAPQRATVVELPESSPAIRAAFRRATQPDYFQWLDHVASAAGCSRPIRLAGTVEAINTSTGQRLVLVDTTGMPDQSIYKACGNRRATVCPSCARVYQYDAYQLLRAGLAGGKGVPETVTTHPAVFLTLTAPSFGTVHNRVVARHTCADRRRCQCRPAPCHARTGPSAPGVCGHGRPAVCFARHDADDLRLGQPFCLDCYDHGHQVVWNAFAGELWHRTKREVERFLARLAKARGVPPVWVRSDTGKPRRVPPVRVSHGKVAEMQRRGAVHFHALIRLDGVNPGDLDAVIPPPAGFTVDDLDQALTYAADRVSFTTPAHRDWAGGWPIGWGDQVDIRPITLDGGEITDTKVAGYCAKYATKATEATGHTSSRYTTDTIAGDADPDGDHIARILNACWHLGRPTSDPIPLSERAQRPRIAVVLGERWTCQKCGTATRLRSCACSDTASQAELDTPPATGVDPALPAQTAPVPAEDPYSRLRRWAHMLGFGGHFLTKARRYSTTFSELRGARLAHRLGTDERATCEHVEQDQAAAVIRTADQDDEDTVLLIGSLTYAGTGWHTLGDQLLANTAATLARSQRQTGRHELDHEIGTILTASTELVAA